MNLGLSFRQSTDECVRPAQMEPARPGDEVKVELSGWENGGGELEKSRVRNLEMSL